MTQDNMGQRITRLETRDEYLHLRVQEHDELITELGEKVSILVTEIKQVRNALYVMAAMIAANIPALSDLFKVLKGLLL